MKIRSLIKALFLVAVGAGWLGRTSGHAVDYMSEVKPLFASQCIQCHGASQQKGGLRLDTAAAALRGGAHGPLISRGNSASAGNLLLEAVRGTHPEIPRMPYKRSALDENQIARLVLWVEAGAPHPENEVPSDDRHWAFLKVTRPTPPRDKSIRGPTPHSMSSANPIDAFINARLFQEGIEASPIADRHTLVRRVYLDLIGLPPAPEEVKAFVEDTQPDAFDRLVDRLVASPHFGERQGRVWLDLARYADSNGYSIDSPRSIWPYRDWVVTALNADLSFDEFTLWQLAGDLLPNSTLEQRIATGFHRNTQVNHEGGIDTEQFRIESVIDRVNTTATVWLGLTLACSQCHDHKFDPFTQREYYELFAFFNSCENDGHGNPQLVAENTLDLGSAEEIANRDKVRGEVRELDQQLKEWAEKELQPRQREWEQQLSLEAREKLSGLARDILAILPAERSTDQSNLVWATFRDMDPEYKQRRKEIETVRRREPYVPTTLVMKERDPPRETALLIKGDFTRRGTVVQASTPAVLSGRASEASGKDAPSLNQVDLARWLVSPENPLTARVVMNRLWQHYFGKGLVETENDFGTQGTPPTHPALLDWLAAEFMAQEWRLKPMHRLIVTSEAYRRSSLARPDLQMRDPRNLLWARQNRIRLDAEAIRDSGLASSGLLVRQLGGPPVFPPQPEGLGVFTQNSREWKTSTGADRYRRAAYTHLQRTILHPSLIVFDAPDASTSCTRRIRSNTPLQSLTLLNDTAFFEFARAMGRRLLDGGDSSSKPDEGRIDLAYQLAVARKPAPDESERLQKLISEERAAGLDETDVWTSVSRVVLNLDEAITRE